MIIRRRLFVNSNLNLAMIFKALAAKALTITVDRYLWPEKHLRNVCEVIICFVTLRN